MMVGRVIAEQNDANLYVIKDQQNLDRYPKSWLCYVSQGENGTWESCDALGMRFQGESLYEVLRGIEGHVSTMEKEV